ncbi:MULTISPECIES: DUF6906 family protein [Lysinibacillus]|uniref:DUF6906 family protein n=1 Tax=Lysinibacillus TaxID=400634 RepID=UPI000A4219CB|nr:MULTISPECIES: hypothetical protein [Lysinibacillus]MEE3809068.1 hypothetical protein [Lysinibacillus fusiformis]
MKNGKRLTVFQCQHLQSLGLEPNDWLLSKKTNVAWVIIERISGNARAIPAP